ncbi:MAG TPA: class I SAM-dependent methyltransferase [Blastocatellia bacterium]|nr:class I SAM-dependent methyltransferase [Blastocatellia bacterium]
MGTVSKLEEFVAQDCPIRLAEEGIYSVLSNGPHSHQYDKEAAIYDFLVGTRLYNKVMWGQFPEEYAVFAHKADTSEPEGPILDAGCGSLLFTARSHIGCGRLVIACDRSIGMLRRARARVARLDSRRVENILFLQADLSEMPFREAVFRTVLCMNVLHHYQDGPGLMTQIKRSLVNGGQLYLTSLVLNNRPIGDKYLGLLHKRKWIARPRSREELKEILDKTSSGKIDLKTMGNMAYAIVACGETEGA